MLIYRWFKCPDCGSVLMFAKKSKRRAQVKEHVKTVYCPVCRRVTDWRIIDYKRIY